MPINDTIFLTIFNLSGKSPIFDSLMVFGAVQLIFLTGFTAAVALIIQRKMKILLFLFLSILFSFLLVKLINLFSYFPRPFIVFPITSLISHSNTSSFPSLHTTVAFSLVFVFIFLKHKLAPFFIFAAFWIALARIYVGVHYPSDILGGILTGLIGAFLAWQFSRLLLPQLLSRFSQKGRG